jgi:hypothetical protein
VPEIGENTYSIRLVHPATMLMAPAISPVALAINTALGMKLSCG